MGVSIGSEAKLLASLSSTSEALEGDDLPAQ